MTTKKRNSITANGNCETPPKEAAPPPLSSFVTMTLDWPEQLPLAFYAGLEELNAGDYYRCHETLEALWLVERRSVREAYQGVLQIAVGCYHLTARANWIGATRKLDEGARRLERVGLGMQKDETYGVAWGALIVDADRLRDHLRTLHPADVARFDPALLPHVRYQVP